MRLKSIKLAGFKSFVDATTVPFPTNMTAIVGPNGCGKSNIIDAVRWVMGESSAKNLRGESMTDVIFNGSTGRQPVGQASIELLFDNSEGKLEGEHGAFAEISIKRKVTREGISQYYLNGTKCRRRDVTDIFLGTGMGPRSYAIIEQGMIARLIESKPEELRVYLEEAAGISKYKERRRDTENRMRRTQDNLDRLSDIRDELAKQLQHLKRQANAAEKFAEYKQTERFDTAKLQTLRWQALEKKRSATAMEAQQLEQQIEQAVLDKTTHESQIEAARTELEERQEVFNAIQAKYYESGAEIAKLEQQLKYQKEQLAREDQELERLFEAEQQLKDQLSVEQARFEEASEHREALEPEFEARADALEACREDLMQKEEALNRWQESWEAYNQNTAQTRQTAEIQQTRMQNAERQLKTLEERKLRLEQELEQLDGQLAELSDGNYAELVATLEEQVGEAQLQINDRRAQLQQLRQEQDASNRRRGELVKNIAEQRAVLASLRTLQQAALNDDDVEQHLDKKGVSGLRPWVAQVVVENGWEVAFEHVVQPWLKGLEISDLDSLNGALGNDLSAVVFEPAVVQADSARSGTMASIVSKECALQSTLNNIYLAETLEEAFSRRKSLKGDESIVCRDGTWLGRHWIKTTSVNEDGSVMERERKINDLETALPSLEEALVKLEQDQDAHREAIRLLEAELAQAEQQLSVLSKELAQANAQDKVQRAKHEQLELRIKRSQNELDEIAHNREAEEENLSLARESWQEAMLALDALVDERNAQQEQREQLQQALEISRQSMQAQQNSAHQLELQRQQCLNSYEQSKAAIARLQNELQQINDKRRAINSNERVDEQELLDAELRLEGMLEARLQDEEKLSEARRVMEQVSLKLREIEGDRSKKETRLQSLRSELESTRMTLQALQMQQNNLVEQIQKDDFTLKGMIEALTPEDSEEALEASLAQLSNRIQRLGPINLAAIDEFKEQSERKDYLDSQHEDLSEALETLLNAIRKIDKETRARFKETYDQVNEGLQRLFPKIFGGGSAHLELTDDDLLETGVAIIARPPGKKNSTIHLLSGGEKALTAIALIFAIFELNPAPFCMLDEVDAPLDDANVGRFANMVKEMSQQVQFIYISHNKVSMEKADQLMGVTMHEPGVSRLVSVDVEEAVALAEA